MIAIRQLVVRDARAHSVRPTRRADVDGHTQVFPVAVNTRGVDTREPLSQSPTPVAYIVG